MGNARHAASAHFVAGGLLRAHWMVSAESVRAGDIPRGQGDEEWGWERLG